jgi:palmitoyltransferase ZDHHC13/17
VKLFISYGAKIETPTKSGLTAMHLAAKNDQILILAWLRNNGMDSNVVDKKNFTPLHYSCLFSSELATAVLLSWKVKVNPINDDGRTPLHLGVTSGSQRIIRSLLLRGADVHIKDVCNKTPLELAIEKGNPEIVNLISTPGLLSMCGIKPPQRPIKFKSILMISYAFLLITCLISMILVLDIQDDYYYIIFTLKIILFVFVVSKNPGYLKKNHEHQLLELAQNVEYFQICPECVTKRPPRSRHCQSCNKCVEKFDHHCPWINNCIGARNLGIFYCFLITTFVIILYSIFNCSYYILSNSFSLASVVAIFWALVGVGFLIPLFLLISVQTRNFLTNTTTNERYSRKIESSTVERSDSDEQVDRNNMFDNVIQMCCNTKNQQYKSRPNNQTENNQRYSFITGEFDLSNPLLKS